MISFGFSVARQAFQFLVVQQPVVAPHAVLDGAEPLAGQVGRRAVGQVAAGGQAHAQDRVARLQQGQEHRLVRLRAGMRLHVGERAGEQPLRPVDRQLSRPHRHTRSRRSSAGPGSPRRICWSAPSPAPPARRRRRRSRWRSARCRPAGGSVRRRVPRPAPDRSRRAGRRRTAAGWRRDAVRSWQAHGLVIGDL